MRRHFWQSMTILVLLTAVPAQAQDVEKPNGPVAFGATTQTLWIAAPEFSGKHYAGQSDLTFSFQYYFNNPGSPTNQPYYAQIPLPAGAEMLGAECHVHDASATNDVLIGVVRPTHNVSTNLPGGILIGQFVSTGTSGYQQIGMSFAPTVIRYSDGDDRHLWFMVAEIASDTRLRGCAIFWRRTVTPAPGIATFTDVPTNHPQFRFIEALVASGITSGCGDGNYCPDAPLTRGQMAVFLSVALGLHWPQ